MAFAAELVNAHAASPAAARHMNGNINLTVSGAGTTQTDATALTTLASNLVVTTCADGAGVLLPAASIGDECCIYSAVSGNQVIIYPDSGAAINQLAANSGMRLSPYTAVLLRRVSSTQWIGWMSA